VTSVPRPTLFHTVRRAAGPALFPEVELQAGARLFLYTDGISEAANPSDEEFGDERLEQLVRAKTDAPPAGLLDRVSDAVAAFCGKASQADDMTMMVVSRPAQPAG